MYMLILTIIGSASFSNLLDDMFMDGMIFAKYGKWVKDGSFWKKPLGGCLICMNVWITGLCYLASFNDIGLKVVTIFFVLGISNTVLKFIIK